MNQLIPKWLRSRPASLPQHQARKHRVRLNVEAFEERQMLNGTSVLPALTSAPVAAPSIRVIDRVTGLRFSLDDVYEDNDTLATATNLGVVSAPRTLADLRLLDSGDNFRFQTTTTGTVHDFVQINFTHSAGDLDFRLYNAAGTLLRSSTGVTNSERISLDGLAAGAYTVQVYGYLGATNANYSLDINYIADLEDNDFSFQTANLGALSSTFSIQQRLLDSDYFRFSMPGVGGANDVVRVDFTHALGDVDLVLLDANGNTLRRSAGVGNSEVISLNGLAAGSYRVGVYGFNNATNPQYTLTITPGTGLPTVGSRILYLNFDGANISRNDLVRYSGGFEFFGTVIGGDYGSFINQLDSDRNGISISRYLNGDANRNAVINRAVQLLQDDLGGFGITVRLHSGLAVENQFATTIFIGNSTLSNGFFHVAADIDYSNNNRTDIAFVGPERVFQRSNGSFTFNSFGNTFSVEGTALALADVILHEAGHTFGLYHVNTNFIGSVFPESMGLRYTEANQDNWIRDTSFMDIRFNEFSTHGGGRGPQNSFRTMMANFGWGGVVPAGAGLGVSGSPAASASPMPTGGGCCCPLCSGAAGRDSVVAESGTDDPMTLALAGAEAAPRYDAGHQQLVDRLFDGDAGLAAVSGLLELGKVRLGTGVAAGGKVAGPVKAPAFDAGALDLGGDDFAVAFAGAGHQAEVEPAGWDGLTVGEMAVNRDDLSA